MAEKFEDVEFIDNKEREYFARAKLGEDVLSFLRGPVGRYLHGCAKQELEAHRDALETCNIDSIFGRRKLRRLQKKADAARYFMQWCTEAIQDGDAAFQEIQDYRT